MSQNFTSPQTILEKEALKMEQNLFGKPTKSLQANLFSKKWWYGRLLRWTLSNPEFKTQMFRFVDVFASLKTPKDITFFLKEYLGEELKGEKGQKMSQLIAHGASFVSPNLVSTFVSKQMKEMSRLFIIGENISSAYPTLTQMRKNKTGFTLDLLGEIALSEAEAQHYQEQYLQIIHELSQHSKDWSSEPIIDQDDRGAIPKVNLSIKVSSLDSLINPTAWQFSQNQIKNKLRPILKMAMDTHTFINIDMEQYAYKNLVLTAFKELILEKNFKDYPHFGLVIQAYLKDSLKDVQELKHFVQKRPAGLVIRLVKGAYWDYELISARQKNWPCPVYLTKAETDQNFLSCAECILKHYPSLRLAIGSHNTHSIARTLYIAQQMKIPQTALEIQMLYGMSEPFKHALIQKNYRFREYCPIGFPIPGMAYLVRRLLENTSNESFLRQQSSIHSTPSVPPKKTTPIVQKSWENAPLCDFSLPVHRECFQKALTDWKAKLPLEVPVVINHQLQFKTEKKVRENPSNLCQTVVKMSLADLNDCEQAIKESLKTFPLWNDTSVKKRSQLLFQLANQMEKNRYTLSALQVLEVGKSWESADADVCEAIDFCRYYAEEAIRLCQPKLTDCVLGEENFYSYRGRGVCAVIAPWNFPLAILTGMTVASLVSGNTVCIKPAEQSSATGYELMKLLLNCGIPKGVVHFLPGHGELVGAYLAKHKDIAIVSFTGSQEVGCSILEESYRLRDEQKNLIKKQNLKKCIVEMGGKNIIIVDDSADLDLAVAGVLESAFGFQGQKCSACSRVAVAESIREVFTKRLLQAVESLPIGSAEDPKNKIGPVIDAEALQKINLYIEEGKKTSRLLTKRNPLKETYFIPPVIFTDVPSDSRLLREEIFGPVLVLIPFSNLDQAITIANDCKFALTGGFYSRSPSRIEQIKRNLQVGNLYINRSCTGAIVKRHPFGGFKMSGLGSKAGGPDYLKQFMNPVVTTENTVRKGGFSPHLF